MSDTPTPSQAAEKAIREALAKFPPGWHTVFNEVREREPGIVDIGALWEDSESLAEAITVDTENYYDTVNAMPIAKFIAACNPEAMTALLDAFTTKDSHLAEMRAEVERLSKNDARYQAIRDAGIQLRLYQFEDPNDCCSGDWLYKPSPEQVDSWCDDALAADGKDGAR